MPDTFTPLLGFEVQQTGANNNTWGAIADVTFASIEDAIARETVIDLTGLTTYTLTVANNSADQARCAYYKFIGALSGDCTVTAPSRARQGWATDATTGGKNVILTSGVGTNLTLPKTGRVPFSTDGTNTTIPALALGSVTATSMIASAETVTGDLHVGGDAVVTGKMTVTGGLSGVLNASTITTTGEVITGVGVGSVHLNPGISTNTGYVAFWTAAGVRAGFIGFGGAGTINFNVDPGFTGWITNGNLTVSGSAFLANAFIGGNQVAFQGSSPTFAAITVTGSEQINGNLNVNGAFSANTVNSNSGVFYIANNPNYYLARNPNDGAWRFVDNNTINYTLDAGGNFTARGNITSQGGFVSFGGGQFFANYSGGNQPYIQWTGSYYIQFVNGIGLEVFSPNFFRINAAGIDINGTGFCLNNGGTYSINITGSAGFASSAGSAPANGGHASVADSAGHAGTADFAGTSNWGGLQGVPGQVWGLNQFVNNDSDVTHHFVQANSGGIAFYAPNGGGLAALPWSGSDARWKENIRDITDDEAIAWVNEARARRFIMGGYDQAGFLAQEDLQSPLRAESVMFHPSDDARATEADGKIPAGHRAWRNYNSDIPYVTHALKLALRQNAALEARIAALEELVTHGR